MWNTKSCRNLLQKLESDVGRRDKERWNHFSERRMIMCFIAIIPFDMGGHADVLQFHPPGMGSTYVTAELIGTEGQKEISRYW